MTLRPASTVVILNWRDRTHPSAGGSELYCERVARELARRGHRVTLVTSKTQGLPAEEVVDGYRVRRSGSWWSVYPRALSWLHRHRSDVDAVIDSANGIPFFSPLVVRSQTPVLLLVHRVHQDLFSQTLPRPLAVLGRWLEGPATRAVYGQRTVVVLSPSTRTAVRRQLGLRGKVRVAPGGADTLEILPRRSAAPRVVVVGRLTPYKRLDSLVAAMGLVRASVPDAVLHLVGDGSERLKLKDLAQQAGAEVVFHGRLSDADRDAVLATAWLTVNASVGGDWALSLIEANAAGVPALARRTTGKRDSVRHGHSGWLVGEDDQRSVLGSEQDLVEGAHRLAAAITQALRDLSDDSTARTMREGARSWASRFTWGRTTDSIVAALGSEITRAGASRRSGERREANDLCVVVEIPLDVMPPGWQASSAVSRLEDLWVLDGDRVRVLLVGADERDAKVLLGRLHIDVDDPSITIEVARHADVVHPAAIISEIAGPPGDQGRGGGA